MSIEEPTAVATLVTTKPDSEIARELREEARPILEGLCRVQQKANQQGLAIGFRIGPDQFGRVVVQTIDIQRPL